MIRISTLPSGLRVLTETMPQVRSVTIGLWCDVGSSFEPAARRGLEVRVAQDLALDAGVLAVEARPAVARSGVVTGQNPGPGRRVRSAAEYGSGSDHEPNPTTGPAAGAEAGAGDLVALAGIETIEIGETVADAENPVALPLIRIDEPTVSMLFSANVSPFAGFLPDVERADLLGAYLRRLTDPDPAVHLPAARAWSVYEGSCSTLLPSPSTVPSFAQDRPARRLAPVPSTHPALPPLHPL